MARSAAIFLCALLLLGCSVRTNPARPPAALPERGSFIDLHPGWRISVITPLLKSGGFVLDRGNGPTRVSGGDKQLIVEMDAGPGFLGYERSYYAVEPRARGVRVRFTSAETVRDGKAAPQARPVAELFRLPGSARYVRLVYLLRSSQVNHNMALLGASDSALLDAAAAALQKDPAQGCQKRSGVVCQWVPAGIAVRPEVKNTEGIWVPAR